MRAFASPVRLARLVFALILSIAVTVSPAAAQSVLRDAETEALFDEAMRPIVEATGLSPGNVKIVVVGDREINAFVAGGQVVYLNSGLIAKADNLNEVQGVVAHELGHITGGHIIRGGEAARGATAITILSLLLGAAAMAAGGGEAGMGVMSAGQQAAMGSFLAYSRVQESSADAAGVEFLRKAGISGKGSLSFFGKLRQQEYRYTSSYAETDPLLRTHPMSADRAARMEPDYRASPAWDKPTPPELEAKFQRVRAKLIGFVEDPPTTLKLFPETDQSVPARYARAYAWHKGAYPERAVQEVDKLLASAPNDPYFLELKGQVLLESGKPEEAIAPLRQAVARSGNSPLIASMLGHALIATENPAHFDEARQVLRVAVARDRENPFAWYQLGIVYDREGDRARAALATAERYNLEGQPRLALASANSAMSGIPQGTPDYLRAQDIAMVSKTAADEESKKKRR